MTKQEVFVLFLQRPTIVQVQVRTDDRSLGLPTRLFKEPWVALDIGYASRIPDFDISDSGVGCTLSFERQPHKCFLPWSAVFAMILPDGQAAVWPEDVPVESPLAAELGQPFSVGSARTGSG